MRLRSAAISLLVLGLECLLTFQVTGKAGSVVCVAIALLMTYALAGQGRAFVATVFVSGGLALVCCLGEFLKDLSGPGAVLLLAQGVQVVAIARRYHRSHTVADGVAFTLAGLVCATMAYDLSSRPLLPLFAECTGTALLVLVFLQHRGWLGGVRSGGARVPAGFVLRWVVMLAVIAAALIVSSLFSRPLRQAADKAWLVLERYRMPGGASSGGQAGTLVVESDDLGDLSLELGGGSGRPKPHVPELHVMIRNDSAGRLQRRQRMYFALSTFDTYQMNKWVISVPRKLMIDEEDGAADGTVAVLRPVRNAISYSVYLRHPLPHSLPGIPRIAAIEQTAIEWNSNGNCFSPVSLKGAERIIYSMTSSDLRWDDLQSGEKIAGTAEAVYRRLPAGELTSRARALAGQITGGSRDLPQVVESVMGYLGKEYRYSSEAESPKGMDPLENFLFHDKKGNCRYFASGFVTLLRAAGLPARVSVGYCGGEYDASRKMLTFFQDEGHAWAEVLVADKGWVLVDPTPASISAPSAPRAARFTGEMGFADALNVSDLVKQRYSGRLSLNPAVSVSWVDRMLTGISPTVWLSVLMLLAAGLIMMAVRLRAFSQEGRQGSSGARGRGVPSYFRMFCSHYSGLGCGLKAGQTAGEYLAELKRRGLVENECDGLVNYFYETAYGQRCPSRAIEKEYQVMVESLRKRAGEVGQRSEVGGAESRIQ